jgi:tetratricopeptide (TPR) repeat protein
LSNNFGVRSTYWHDRTGMMYYQYIDILVRAFANNANNILDVGTANTQYIENFYWIKDKYTLDIKNPYKSPNVKAIEIDFLEYQPEKKFDFVTCLQVLEHIQDVREFSQKLLEVSDKLLISVPFKWPANAEEEHIHDPIDLDKVTEWMGREPSYHLIVEEPVRNPKVAKSKRLICYFQREKIDYAQALKSVKESYKENNMNNTETDFYNEKSILFKEFEKIKEDQQLFVELLRIERVNNERKKQLSELMKENNLKQQKLNELNRELEKISKKINKIKMTRRSIERKRASIQNSRSWKWTDPVRNLIKKIRS